MRIKPRIFIASSSGAKDLVNTLKKSIDDESGNRFDVEPWFQPIGSPVGSHLLTHLIERSRKADFAVVMLTRDQTVDQTADQTGASGPVQRAEVGGAVDEDEVPRYNCVFELGLFIGAFGGSRRCYLVSELEHEVLCEQLSDLGGLLYEHLPLADAIKDGEPSRGERIRGIAREIRERLDAVGRYSHRPRYAALRLEDVLEKEGLPGNLSRHDVVVVKEQIPAETEIAAAQTVADNIMGRGIRYHYLFGRTEGKFESKIIEMLRSFIAAAVLAGSEEKKDFYDADDAFRVELLERAWVRDREGVINAIDNLRRDLIVGFVDDIRFDEFCIHRANSERRCEGFLKLSSTSRIKGEPGERWVPLERVDTHLRMGHDAYGALTNHRKEWAAGKIFRRTGTEAVNKDEEQRLRAAIERQFPVSYRRRLTEACFGSGPNEKDDAQTPRASRPRRWSDQSSANSGALL